jgi:hypothetical protein
MLAFAAESEVTWGPKCSLVQNPNHWPNNLLKQLRTEVAQAQEHSLKLIRLGLQSLLIAVVVLYAVDWGIFQARRSKGTAMGTISVEQYLATPLKGNKAEYDYMGNADENCSRSLFPQYASSTWNPPCWWLAHHNQRWQ